MVWYVVSIIAFAAALALLVFTRVRDRRYERKKVSEVMRPVVLDELKEEEDAAHTRQEKFHEALNDARTKGA